MVNQNDITKAKGFVPAALCLELENVNCALLGRRFDKLNYIGYVQLEELLRKLPALRSHLGNMQTEFKRQIFTRKATQERNKITASELLYTLAIGNKTLSDMPFSSSFSQEKLTDIVLVKDKILEEIILDDDTIDGYLLQIKDEIQIIGQVIDNIIESLNGIPLERRHILLDFYCEKKTWKEITRFRKIEKNQAQLDRREALEEMMKTQKITRDRYDYCMDRII